MCKEYRDCQVVVRAPVSLEVSEIGNQPNSDLRFHFAVFAIANIDSLIVTGQHQNMPIASNQRDEVCLEPKQDRV